MDNDDDDKEAMMTMTRMITANVTIRKKQAGGIEAEMGTNSLFCYFVTISNDC